jgi:hypothetical protein
MAELRAAEGIMLSRLANGEARTLRGAVTRGANRHCVTMRVRLYSGDMMPDFRTQFG